MISECYSTGSINATAPSVTNSLHAGGFIGMNAYNETIENCYARGDVCLDGVAASDAYLGGFIGNNYTNNTITNCYSIGEVLSPATNGGGFSGKTANVSNISGCYWDTETSGWDTSDAGTGKITTEMKTQSTYTDWSFDSIWEMSTSINTEFHSQSRITWYPPDTSDYSHLEGETVQCLGDGIYQGEEVVVSGDVSLDDDTTNNHVGLKITSRLQPMKINGVGSVKRISKIVPDVYESLDGEYGEDLTDMYSMTLRDSDDPMDRDGDLYSGYIKLPFKGRYDRHGDIWIQADTPLPFNLIGLGVNLSLETV